MPDLRSLYSQASNPSEQYPNHAYVGHPKEFAGQNLKPPPLINAHNRLRVQTVPHQLLSPK
ncbi:unnamed protein product [Schistosoma curassoni]|uniref:Uncharacterized protein n=1 Tax=Schistosoma curassoni TaxID=6186 RepID=A0A183KMK7_9TREM|nr:unnamed protein product [Schistosoma curassoni]